MKKNTPQPFAMDSLESRTMLAAQVIGYLPDYQRAKMLEPNTVVGTPDWNAMTQLNYFSFRPEVFVDSATPENTSSDGSIEMMDGTVAAARAANPDLQINIVLGGANGYGDAFPSIANNPDKLEDFVTNLRTFCASHGFDGVDLDWEPLWGTAQSDDIASYGHLITTLNAGAPELSISAAVAPNAVPTDGSELDADKMFVIPKSALGALDYLNVMAYDYNLGAAHSPYQDSVDSIDGWVAEAQGHLDKSRITLGVPFYGRDNAGWGEGHEITYGQIVRNWGAQSTDQTHGWYFNRPATIQAKADYVMDHQYGGVMIWDISQDYFTPGTLQYDANLSLMPVIKNTVLGETAPTVGATLNNGELTINGSSGNDNITLTNYRNRLIVWINSNVGTQFDYFEVSHITINGNGGNDNVTNNLPIPTTFNTGPNGSAVLNLTAPSVTFNEDAGADGNVGINVAEGSTVTFNTTQTLESLNVSGTAVMPANGNHVLFTESLSFGATGKLDLTNNGLVMDYSSTPSGLAVNPLSDVQGWINSARAGGAWTGNGLTSSAAAAAQQQNRTLGAMSGADYRSIYGANAMFDGQAVDATSVVVMFTYYGDADFSGKVNFDDYARIDRGFNQHRTGWINGDFNGDGVVNFDDYTLIDRAYNTQNAPASGVIAPKIKPIGTGGGLFRM